MIVVKSTLPRATYSGTMTRYALALVILVSAACNTPDPPTSTFFDRNIQPILNASCAGSTAPCHKDDGTGVANGNFDVTSFEALHQRTDLLRRYGSYPEPLLLIKAVSSQGLFIPYRDEFYPLEIEHAAGAIMHVTSDAYFTLKQWLDNGATLNGLPPQRDGLTGTGACNEFIPTDLDISGVTASSPGFAEFEQVQPYLIASCGAGSCHGTSGADYYLTCGSTDEQRRVNYLMTRAFVADVVDDSELLIRPLDPTLGGDWHTGGAFFDSRSNADYVSLRDWAETAGALELGDRSPARVFFDENVTPVLLQRGCASQACHSSITPHKFRLRAGSNGFMSPLVADINYKQAHKGFINLGSPDPKASRLVAKNLIPSHGGIAHRAGPVLETPGASADPADCVQPFDPLTAPAFCILTEWLRLERGELPSQYRADLSGGQTMPLVYVERPADTARPIEFGQYRPGADLIRTEASIGTSAQVTSAAGRLSLLDSCPGVGAGRADIDVRAPEISYDGLRVAFGLRIGASDGLNVYEVGIDGTGCRKLTTDGGTEVNGIRIDNFDPTYVVDKADVEWVVYASTRGGADGPTRTPKQLLPNSDLWRQPSAGGPAEQMTFLRGMESQPSIMGNGQLTMTKEKQSEDFYQICGKRINWDLSDYHPLLGNRRENFEGRGGYLPGAAPADAVMRPSMGYDQITEIRQGLHGNFMFVLADEGRFGQGGAIGTFNRSIGPFEAGRSDGAFLRSLIVLPGPSGRNGDASGAYRSPYPLPDGSILASYAANVDVGQSSGIDYDIVIIDPISGARTPLISGGGSQVEAVLAYARPPPKVLELPDTGKFGTTADMALVHFPDLPLLSTILDSNNRRGRDVEPLRNATEVRFFAHAPPPAECTTPDHPSCSSNMTGDEQVYSSRIELGGAPIADDGSVYARVPAGKALFFELLDDSGSVLFRLREEFQFGPYEVIGIGVPQPSFNTMCAGCHGSVNGRELEIAVTPDAVTMASATVARDREPAGLQ